MIIATAAGIFAGACAARSASSLITEAIQLREGAYHLNRLHSISLALQTGAGTIPEYASAWSASHAALGSMTAIDSTWNTARPAIEQLQTTMTSGRIDQLPSSTTTLSAIAHRLADHSNQKAAAAFSQLQIALVATLIVGSTGFLFFVVLLTRLLHRISYTFTSLMEELHNCSNSSNVITLPARRPDELDTLLLRVRNHLYTHRSRLQTYRSLTSESIDKSNQARRTIRNFQSTTATLSAMHTSLRGHIESFSQLLSNTNEILGVLQHKSGRMSQQGENQATQVTQTTSAIEQIDSSIHAIAQRAEARRMQAIELRSKARSDEEGIQQTRDTIGLIADSITGIEEILQTIHAISEQTSLLSLNAFIESAHGTEPNKGFEVVASEIRSLADSTAENAASIHHLLHSIDDRVREAQFFSEKTLHSFTASVEVIEDFAASMQSIAAGMQVSTDISGKVVHAAAALSQRADQIKQLSTQVDQSTGESRATLSSASQSSDQLHTILQTADASLQKLDHWIGETNNIQRQPESLLNRISHQLNKQIDTSQTDSPT